MPDSRPLRAGILGAGFIAQAHAAAYAATPGVEVAFVADPRQEYAERLAARLGARALNSAEALFATDVDMVSICTPTPTHAAMSMAALAAGKHVLCEKPIARYAEDAEAMIAAAAAAQRSLMVGHVSRFEVDHRRAWEIVQRGDLGPLRMASQSLTGAFPEWSSGGWFADESQSGGPVVDLAIHSIDYLLWLFQSPVVRVAAVGVQRMINLYTFASITIRFANGGMGIVETSWCHPRSQGLTLSTEIIGTQGRIAWDYEGITGMRIAGEEKKRSVVMPGESSFGSEIGAFVESIRAGTPPPVSGQEALNALRVSLAALESLHTGQPVTLA